MATKVSYAPWFSKSSLLSNKDWITIIAALMNGDSKSSRQLTKKLLIKTKSGRHVRLLRFLHNKRPKIEQMVRMVKVSRRTIFRDLNELEEYGVRLQIDEKHRYEIAYMPENLRELI